MPAGQWYTPENIGEVWRDAPEDEEILELLVEAALENVLDYLPESARGEGVTIRASWRMGQLMHTKNVWNASRVDPDGGTGEGDFVIRPFPLDWQVKQQLRPKKPGQPVVT